MKLLVFMVPPLLTGISEPYHEPAESYLNSHNILNNFNVTIPPTAYCIVP